MPLAPPVTTATGVNDRDWAGAVVLVEVKADSRLRILWCRCDVLRRRLTIKMGASAPNLSGPSETVTKCRFRRGRSRLRICLRHDFELSTLSLQPSPMAIRASPAGFIVAPLRVKVLTTRDAIAGKALANTDRQTRSRAWHLSYLNSLALKAIDLLALTAGEFAWRLPIKGSKPSWCLGAF